MRGVVGGGGRWWSRSVGRPRPGPQPAAGGCPCWSRGAVYSDVAMSTRHALTCGLTAPWVSCSCWGRAGRARRCSWTVGGRGGERPVGGFQMGNNLLLFHSMFKDRADSPPYEPGVWAQGAACYGGLVCTSPLYSLRLYLSCLSYQHGENRNVVILSPRFLIEPLRITEHFRSWFFSYILPIAMHYWILVQIRWNHKVSHVHDLHQLSVWVIFVAFLIKMRSRTPNTQKSTQ